MAEESSSKLECNICGSASFASRNQLFKHIKACVSLKPTDIAVAPDPIDRLRESIGDSSDLRIYICGGRLRGRTLKSAEYFSLKELKWSLCPHMLENRGSHASVAIDQSIYSIGGGGLRSNLSTCEVFDIKKQIWSFLPSPMLTYRHALSVVSDGVRFIYAVGGWENGSRCSTFIERYDIESQKWDRLADMITPRRLMGAALWNGKIFTFGGVGDNIHESGQSNAHALATQPTPLEVIDATDDCIEEKMGWFSNSVEVYDISTDTWEKKTSKLPFADATSAIAVIGSPGEGHSGVYVFIHGKGCFKYDDIKDNYVAKGDLPLRNWYNFDLTTYKEFIFLHGGVSHGNWLKVLYMYDTKNNTWTELPPMLRLRRRCAAALVVL